jgi:hypothetical protein
LTYVFDECITPVTLLTREINTLIDDIIPLMQAIDPVKPPEKILKKDYRIEPAIDKARIVFGQKST